MMFKSFLRFLPASLAEVTKQKPHDVSKTINLIEGYHLPLTGRELLFTPQRQPWLQMLWDYSPLPKAIYQHYYLQPLEQCVALMQQFPATENGHHVYLGGMVDHLLETVAYAARLSKNYLLPIGAPPEEQASQSAAWHSVIIYAALLQSLDGLASSVHLTVNIRPVFS